MTMNSDHAYILGVLLGDGSVSYYARRRQYVVSLTTTDQPFADAFANALKRVGKIPWEGTIAARGGRYLRVQTYSKALYEMAHPRVVPMDLEHASTAAFVRGFYESEGYDRGRGRGLEIYNTEAALLGVVQHFLARDGLTTVIKPRWRVPQTGPGSKRLWYLVVPARLKAEFFARYQPCIKVADPTLWEDWRARGTTPRPRGSSAASVASDEITRRASCACSDPGPPE